MSEEAAFGSGGISTGARVLVAWGVVAWLLGCLGSGELGSDL